MIYSVPLAVFHTRCFHGQDIILLAESCFNIVHLFSDWMKSSDLIVCQYVNHFRNFDNYHSQPGNSAFTFETSQSTKCHPSKSRVNVDFVSIETPHGHSEFPLPAISDIDPSSSSYPLFTSIRYIVYEFQLRTCRSDNCID